MELSRAAFTLPGGAHTTERHDTSQYTHTSVASVVGSISTANLRPFPSRETLPTLETSGAVQGTTKEAASPPLPSPSLHTGAVQGKKKQENAL